MIRTTPIPFLGECYADEARPFSSQDVFNWLPAPAEKGGTLTPEMAQTPPGLRPFVQVSGANATRPVRGTHNCEGKLFSTIGRTLYQISNSGVAIPIGTVPGVSRVAFAHNQVTSGNQLVVVNGSSGYVYDTPTEVYERITDDGYPGAITADFVDGYIVSIEPGRRFAFNSDLANAKAYNTLDRFTSEYRPDLLVTQVISNNELILLSETSGEVFYNSGAAQQPFRTKRVFFDKGCSGRSNAKVIDNSFVFHANDGMFYLYDNGTPKRISTRPIEQAVREQSAKWSQGFCEVWVDGGHSVAYWTFPGGHTWGWDASSGKWHRRESYGLDRWRVNTLTRWNDEWIAGDFQAGRLWVVDWDYLLEGDQEFVSGITGVVISDSQNPLKMPRLEVLMDTGQEETVAIPFSSQPEGPTLAGAYPNGTVGVENAAFPYVASGGTPPYTFTNRPGNAPAPGIGLMAGTGIVPESTPTEIGAYEHRPRVTDANGLYFDLIDPYTVNAMVLTLGSPGASPGTYAVMQVPDTTDWNNAYTVVAAYQNMLAVGNGRVLVWSYLNHSYTDDYGLTFSTPVGDLGSLVGARQGCYVEGVIVIPGNNAQARTYRSTDNGASFTMVSQGSNFLWRAVANGSDIVFNSHAAFNSRFYYSTDLGLTSNAGGLTNLTTSGGDSLASFGGKVVCGGINASNFPGVSVTEDYATVANHQVNTDTGIHVSALCGALVEGVERWVIGLSNGKVYWTEDFVTYTQWVESLTGTVHAITFDGTSFLVGGDNTTYVLTSPDGKVGTQRTSALGDDISNIVVVR